MAECGPWEATAWQGSRDGSGDSGRRDRDRQRLPLRFMRKEGGWWLGWEGSRGSGAGERTLALLAHESIVTTMITIF